MTRWTSRLRVLPAAMVLALAIVATAVSPHDDPGPSLVPVPAHRTDAEASGPSRSAEALAYYDRAFPRTVPPTAYLRGIAQAKRLTRLQVAGGWRELGPVYAPRANVRNPKTHASTAVSGRLTSLAVDPSTCRADVCSTIYAGSASGGVWKTTSAGADWQPLTDSQIDLATGVITLDPRNPNIVYVGTGDPDHGANSHRGIGILRSTDAGRTWENLGSAEFANRAISSIVVDPRTAGSTDATLYVTSTRSASGGAPTGGQSTSDNPQLPSLGFYFSKDGGRTWTQSVPQDGGQDGTGGLQAQGLVMNASDPNILYAAFDFAGVYKTTDDGVTWQHLTAGLPSSGFSYIRLDISQSDAAVLYAAYDMDPQGNGPEVLFRSPNGGASWTRLTGAPNACAEQCFGNMHLAVDPVNPNIVYAGGTANYGYVFGENRRCNSFSPFPVGCHTALMKSSNGGGTWRDIAENGKGGPVHPDNHATVVDPNNHNVIYEAGDGGIFHSANGGKNWNDLNLRLATFQADALSVGPTGRIYLGTQDNGTFMYTGSKTWYHSNDGDGGIMSADPKNLATSYNTQAGATLFRNDSNGKYGRNIWIAPFHGDYDVKNRGQFYEPFALAPSRPKDIFFGTYRIWRSKLGGGVNGPHRDSYGPDATDDRTDRVDWQPISFDLSCGSARRRVGATCDSSANRGQGISALTVSPSNPNVVAAATANGHVWITTNALASVRTDRTCDPRTNNDLIAKCAFVSGVHWTRIDGGLPDRFPSSLHFAPDSSRTLYLTMSGFNQNTPGAAGHVFQTSDRGGHWKAIDGTDASAALPDLPFSDIVVNPQNGHLYASADFGVYYSADGGRSWSAMAGGLSGAPVYQMQLSAKRHALVVATYGRGVWESSAP